VTVTPVPTKFIDDAAVVKEVPSSNTCKDTPEVPELPLVPAAPDVPLDP